MRNEIEVETLHDVKIGDEFIIKIHVGIINLKIVTCTHVTPKQAIIGEYTYKKEKAFSYSNPTLYEATDELRLEVKKMRRRHFVKVTDYTKLDDEKIEAIFKILKPNCP